MNVMMSSRALLCIVICNLPVCGSVESMCQGRDMVWLCMCCSSMWFCIVLVCSFCYRQHNLMEQVALQENGASDPVAVVHCTSHLYVEPLDQVGEDPAGLTAWPSAPTLLFCTLHEYVVD